MPKYFFDIHDSQGVTADEFGEEFRSLQHVCRHALTVLPDLARDDKEGAENSFVLHVRNSAGTEIFRASLVMSTAWLVDETDGMTQPGANRMVAAITRLSAQFDKIRRDMIDERLSSQMPEIDRLVAKVHGEIEKFKIAVIDTS